MPDAEFEKTFSDLAFARLRDKAPGLLDHLVGFQLLDKSEDNTHAVGVWGFKVGDEWLYAPVFFLNGQLKGDDLLYLKSQDAFVPLKENWINYLLNRRPYVLGETEMEQPSELGIRQPDFNAFARPPYTGSKYASAGHLRSLVDYLATTVADDFKPFLPVVMAAPGGEKRAGLEKTFTVTAFLKRAGQKAAATLLDTMRKNAGFADAVLKFYSMEDICAAAKVAFTKSAADGDKMIEGTAPKVRIMVADRADVNDLESAMLSDEEKEKLQRDRFLVKDRRGDDEVSTVYHRRISQTLQNPLCSAYCRVLMTDGSFKDRMIIMNPIGNQPAYVEDRGMVVVIDMDNGNRMLMANPKDLFVDNEMHNAEDWQSHFNGLPEPGSVKEKDKVVFVNEKGDGTMPFFVERRIVTADGQVQLYGEFDTYPHAVASDNDKMQKMLYPKYRGRYFNESDARSRYSGDYPIIGSGRTGPCMIVTNKPGNKITQIGRDFFVPNGFKAIKISKKDIEPWKLRDRERYDNVPEREEKPEELASPQTLVDIELQLFKSAAFVELQPVTDGIEWWIGINGNRGRPMSKIAAMKTLVIDYSLREKDARNLLKLATRDNARRYMVKRAQPTGPATVPEPIMSSDPTLFTNPPVLYPQTDLVSANETPLDRYGAQNMDMDSTFYAQQAAQQGQKEVLDTSVISGLVKVMDPDAVVDQYIGDLMLGLDRVGRILFMYYWHFNKFKDRYGSQDMPELEDNLKNVFDNMGDLTLFLKQKTIEPEVSGASAEAELEQVI